ncbi:GlcG/HbpS family heme-binding protein [Aureimonas leprariae]|uniref:Heme-binding protein n=1 Tax=Plantimonas leprariae TaxID=2615207 RepID=A0A7V7TXM3_9HYPH|nr:heme-binding protein [Aureimonas leprariae]KAB0681250.1 heme-binding protein [Aureimonas leprariae]
MPLDLDTARRIVAAARAKGRELGLKPLTVAVLDAGGDLLSLEREDGASPLRPAIAIGKANGAVQMGLNSRALMARAEQQPFFIQSMNALAGGSLVPVPGGVLVREGGRILGAVGITGDTSDNDEAAALAGIEAVNLEADKG